MIDKDKILGSLGGDKKAASLLNDQKKLTEILNSDEAKKLLGILNRDGGASLRKAAEAISAGDSDKAMEILEPIMSGSEAEKLADELNRKAGK